MGCGGAGARGRGVLAGLSGGGGLLSLYETGSVREPEEVKGAYGEGGVLVVKLLVIHEGFKGGRVGLQEGVGGHETLLLVKSVYK